MAVGLYMDVHVRRAVTVGLRLRGVDVLTAQEDGAGNMMTRDCLTARQNQVAFFSLTTMIC